MTDLTYNVSVSMSGGGSAVLDGVYNVKSFGALGDNSNDDTSAVQAAINQALTAGRGSRVFFPNGLYKITDTLTASYTSTYAQLTLFGDGKHASRLLHYATGSENLLEIDAWVTSNESFHIEDLGFSLISGTGGDAINVLNASRGEINNCYIYGFTGGAGIKFDAENNKSSDLNRVNSTYIGNCQDGIWNDLSATTNSYCDALQIDNCAIINNTRYDVHFSNSGALAKANANFICNTWIQCLSTGVHGIFIDDEVGRCKISNVSLDGEPATTCITISATSLGDNLITNVSCDGGFSDTANLAEFSNCHFTATGQTDLRDKRTTYGLIPASEPAAPIEGMFYYDSATNKLKVYTGSAWEAITSA